MRHLTFLAIFCVILATILAAPSERKSIFMASDYYKIIEKRRIQTALREIDLLELSTQDYVADLIQAILGVTAGQLLTSIEHNMIELSYLINNGVTELHNLSHQLDSQTQQQIQDVINQMLYDALPSIKPILQDLGLVLPSITSKAVVQRSVTDLIRAILGISLEDLLYNITAVLELSETLLLRTTTDLSSIANSIPDSSASLSLKAISDNYLEKGRSVIKPVISSLYQVLPPTNTARDDRIWAKVISEAIGFDVEETATKLDTTLEQVEITLTKFVTQINLILGQSQIRNQVNKIVKDSVHDIEARIQPILNVLLPFERNFSADKNVVTEHDIISSLLGMSLEHFLNYMDFVIQGVQKIYNKATEDIRQASSSLSRPYQHFQVTRLIERTKDKLDKKVRPLLESIAPILGEKKWVSVEEFVEITNNSKYEDESENVFCNFSFSSGYNLDLIIHLVSKVFGFDVVSAANEMSNVIQKLDDLYMASSMEMRNLLAHEHPFIINEVDRILNASIHTSHNVMQPALDVFVQFIPNNDRYAKDIVSEIIHSIQDLKYESFKQYMHFATTRLTEVSKSAFSSVHHVVNSGLIGIHKDYENIVDKVDMVMMQTLVTTQQIAEPFFEIILPFLES